MLQYQMMKHKSQHRPVPNPNVDRTICTNCCLNPKNLNLYFAYTSYLLATISTNNLFLPALFFVPKASLPVSPIALLSDNQKYLPPTDTRHDYARAISRNPVRAALIEICRGALSTRPARKTLVSHPSLNLSSSSLVG